MSTALPNEMILASAGSGKTWQLTNRFIALMGQQRMAGVDVTPERIVAVTFTRKAAGEFFDSILVKLAKAAASEDFAAGLAGDEKVDPEAKNDPLRPILRSLSSDDYRALLRVFISRMPRLFLGTLDSFFSGILRSFPAEFGLAGDFEILSQHQATVERERVYQQVFQRTLPGLQSRPDGLAAQKNFLEAFRRATFGREEAGIRSVLDQFIENHHEILLHAAREQLWGDPRVIWPQGCHWLQRLDDVEAALVRLFAELETLNMEESQQSFWDEFRAEVPRHVPGSALPRRLHSFLEKVLPAWSELEAGEFTLTVNRKKQKLGKSICAAFLPILRHIVAGELITRLERTRGVWQVLSLYEENWSHQVRRRGRLTFQDMELILAGHEFSADMPRPILTQTADAEARLRIDYRLDARYDHWLLDEFQDTNHVQWKVIENLIDEAVQDSSDERTLFLVGDVKQAIYAWRGGDTRLLDDIRARYNAGSQDRIATRPLNVSWRSGHDVIDMVNRVFGHNAAFEEVKLPLETRQRWPWRPHSVAGVHDAMPGHAVLLHPLPSGGGKVTEEERFALTVGILEEIQPVARGLSCAILVQDNRTGRALVDHIRAHSPSRIPVLCESEIAIATDNALTLALLSIIKVAAHPGDTMAWEHLRMTPFRAVLERMEMTLGRMVDSVLRQIFEEGFEAVLRRWQRELESTGGVVLDAFSLRRAEELALAARLFDQGGGRDADEFLAYAASYTSREPDTHGAVQIMTIHKSKGLTFDCVILPDVEGDKLTDVRRGIGVKRGPQRQVEWIYDLPPSDIVRADPVLRQYREDLEAEAAYEELCKFYVALTRAKHANYVIAAPRSATSKSENFVKLLGITLGEGGDDCDACQFGGVDAVIAYQSATKATDPRWFEQVARESATPEPQVSQEMPTVSAPGRQRPVRRTPSGSEKAVVTAKQLFSRGGGFARAHGTLVHALLEQIEWLDEMSEADLAARWVAVPCAEPNQRQRAEDEARRSLSVPAMRAALSRPSPQAVCWREKRFEILLKDEWLSGTFDRVVIEPGHATILDFKTDKTDSDEALAARVEGYRPQLETYREVLSRMTGLSTDKIACRLLFTQRGTVVEL